MTSPVFLLLILSILSIFAQQYPTIYRPDVVNTIFEKNPNSQGDPTTFQVKRKGGVTRSVIRVKIDGTSNLVNVDDPDVYLGVFETDCNHWKNTVSVELKIPIANVEGCPNGISPNSPGCEVTLFSTPTVIGQEVTWNCPNDNNLGNNGPNCPSQWEGGDIDDSTNQIAATTVYDGQTGLVSFDITSFVKSIPSGGDYVVNFVLALTRGSVGNVTFSNSPTTYPYVFVTNPPRFTSPDGSNPPCARIYVPTSGFSLAVYHCSPVNPDNITRSRPATFIVPEQPSCAANHMDFAYLLSTKYNGDVYIVDPMGTCFSSKPLDRTVFNYTNLGHVQTYLDAIDYLNMTLGGTRKIYVNGYEIGSMSALYLAYLLKLQGKLAGAYTTTNSYLRTCPLLYSNEPNNPPPYLGGTAVCQHETLVPRTSPFGTDWELWRTCVYPDYNCSCWNPFLRFIFFTAPGRYFLFSPASPPPQQWVDYLLSNLPGLGADPNCLQQRLLFFPQLLVPVPVDGEPAEAAMVIDTINWFYQNSTDVPWAFGYYDPSNPDAPTHSQILNARLLHPGVTTFNYGCVLAHISPYDAHYNKALHVGDWQYMVEGNPIRHSPYPPDVY